MCLLLVTLPCVLGQSAGSPLVASAPVHSNGPEDAELCQVSLVCKSHNGSHSLPPLMMLTLCPTDADCNYKRLLCLSSVVRGHYLSGVMSLTSGEPTLNCLQNLVG